jgi:hypothetical protein
LDGTSACGESCSSSLGRGYPNQPADITVTSSQ